MALSKDSPDETTIPDSPQYAILFLCEARSVKIGVWSPLVALALHLELSDLG